MEKFSNASQILTTEMRDDDLEKAIQYATISLPWTFDRMQYGIKSQRVVNDRIMNILKGVLNQSILKRALEERGYDCGTDWSNYRESDIFDFEVNDRLYDVKTTHVYSEYGESGSQYGGSREPISPELIEKYQANEGPEWKTFLPMIVPFTQLEGSRKKDAFIFGIAETQNDIRRTEPEKGQDGFWVAAPYNEGKDRGTHFFHTQKAILAREEKGQGFNIEFQWADKQTTLSEGDNKKVEITLFGEWNGVRREETFSLRRHGTYISDTEFSSFSMARVKNAGVLSESDEITVTPHSHYDGEIPKPTNPNIDLDNDDLEWVLEHDSFVNLRMPSEYSVMWIGYIPKEEFFEEFQQYKAWFNPKEDLSKNEPARATESVKKEFRRLDEKRQELIDEGEEVSRPELMSFVRDDEEIDAGILHAAYNPSGPLGAASYYYPPYTFREKALYILPKDLYTMDNIPKNN
jgi:hypothetical protein